MRRAGFSPYGPSKAALESESLIWAQDLAGTGVTENARLPRGATDAGIVPQDIPPRLRQQLLHPDIMIPPLLWLVSEAASGVTGSRFAAILWDATLPREQAAEKSRASAGWTPQNASGAEVRLDPAIIIGLMHLTIRNNSAILGA